MANFISWADFNKATFSNEADFNKATFLDKAYFSGEFRGPIYFNYTIFEKLTKVTFDIINMSNVSFSDSDITRIRFSDKVGMWWQIYNHWGEVAYGRSLDSRPYL